MPKAEDIAMLLRKAEILIRQENSSSFLKISRHFRTFLLQMEKGGRRRFSYLLFPHLLFQRRHGSCDISLPPFFQWFLGVTILRAAQTLTGAWGMTFLVACAVLTQQTCSYVKDRICIPQMNCRLLTRFLQFLTRFKLWHFLSWNLNFFASTWISSGTGWLLSYHKVSKAYKTNIIACFKSPLLFRKRCLL